MNHSLWELSLYNRHRHDELLAERQTCADLSLLLPHATLAAFRRTLGLRLIAAGRALAGADALHEANRPIRPAV
ncbi:MAG: hypothetical protein M3Z20_17745 [Chloroflexota bacterium]|nr:hypothetical protein [Chloroflexota bacterium]